MKKFKKDKPVESDYEIFYCKCGAKLVFVTCFFRSYVFVCSRENCHERYTIKIYDQEAM